METTYIKLSDFAIEHTDAMKKENKPLTTEQMEAIYIFIERYKKYEEALTN